ncbi:TIGR04222 domain-containing membrane protein [Lysobacter firmicutimachus]|uniref:TIGR04222 domain-containing membrane protein n=1 Tax=Lysobacter firmicutimachus TaxID=1792846 RepID=A0ABU8D895_9GAMM
MSGAHAWTAGQRALWQRLRDYRFGGDADEAFVSRVAHECGCDRETALAALEEYRRFCFLAIEAGHAVTPSRFVDRVWHVHVTDTRDYWERFCPQVLQRPLHHAPSRGGADEDERHRRQYRDTCTSYGFFFGEPPVRFWGEAEPEPVSAPAAAAQPPSGLPWPSEPRGLGRAFWIWSALSAAALALGAAAHGTIDALQWRGGAFLALYAALLGWTFVTGGAAQRALRGPNRRSERTVDDPVALGFLAAGPQRAADVAIVELLSSEAFKLDLSGAASRSDASRAWLRRHRPDAALPPRLQAAAALVQRKQRLDDAHRALEAHYRGLAEPMRAQGWWLTSAQDWQARAVAALPMLVLIGFGLSKIGIGLARDRPVGFLVVLTLLAALLTAVRLSSLQRRSRSGDWALHDAARRVRERGDYGDYGARVALAGSSALVGTALVDYHWVRTPTPSSSSDSGSGTSSCSGGGSCGGGGGCGGCGS